MPARKMMTVCVLGLAITTGSLSADDVRLTLGSDGNWDDAANWFNNTHPGKSGALPGATDQVILRGASVAITTDVTVGYLKSGVNKPANVIIDGGSLTTVGTSEYNSASYDAPGVLIVQNGGKALFNSYFLVGAKQNAEGRVEINNGTLRVADVYIHNDKCKDPDKTNIRTTINAGGLLDVGALKLGSGVMDIAGGTVIARRNSVEQVNKYVSDGRIIAMGGSTDWKIEATEDADNLCLIIIAVSTDPAKPKPQPLPVPDPIPWPPPKPEPPPAPEPPPEVKPFIVGMLNPVLLFVR